ncbi:BRO-N domain-containing protein [Acidithiobacillus ferrooxidans]|nr:Bro-N domain-containing protein [Acidithiobacillus ferrooxidans]MCR1341781.1 Bro-N domain-containing protein [Acidithiobacillus ferrooxidans]QZT53851.1 Bro-N domain-containing protein [Acidithiobacillus ferrooxidans]BDB14039.1 hypothetical protein ANFP_13590 [Acidithiobacillus ferrooxidans]
MYDLTNTDELGNRIASFSFKNMQVRVVIKDGEPWFAAHDVAMALEYAKARDMTRILGEDEKSIHKVRTLGGGQDLLVINEKGLYRAIFGSRKPEALAFQDWVFGEVLPAIRKQGFYGQAPSTDKPSIAHTDIKEPYQPLGIIVRRHFKVWMIFSDGRAREVWQPMRGVIIGNIGILTKIAMGEVPTGMDTHKPEKYDAQFSPVKVSVGYDESVLLLTDHGDPVITGFRPSVIMVGTRQDTDDHIKENGLKLAFPLRWMEPD